MSTVAGVCRIRNDHWHSMYRVLASAVISGSTVHTVCRCQGIQYRIWCGGLLGMVCVQLSSLGLGLCWDLFARAELWSRAVDVPLKSWGQKAECSCWLVAAAAAAAVYSVLKLTQLELLPVATCMCWCWQEEGVLRPHQRWAPLFPTERSPVSSMG